MPFLKETPAALLIRMVFKVDERQPPDRHHYDRFRIGWREGATGTRYQDETYKTLTWQNLGNRLGRMYGTQPDAIIDEVYDAFADHFQAGGKSQLSFWD